MSRAISLVFSLAIAVVIAGGLSMPADARPDTGQPITTAERASSVGTSPGSGQQPHTESRGNEPRTDQGPPSRDTSRTAGPQETSPAPATASPGRPDSRPTGAKTRAEQPPPARSVQPRAEQPPPVRSVERPGIPSESAPAPVTPDQPVGVPGTAPVESPGTTAPVTPPTAPPVVADQPDGGPAPATTSPVGPAPPPATGSPAGGGTAAPAVTSPAGPEASAPASPSVRISVVGAWFADRIHGLMASPPVLPRPELGPLQPADVPTAFGLLFSLLGAWYILQRVAWNRLGHVPMTSPPGPGWDVAHG